MINTLNIKKRLTKPFTILMIFTVLITIYLVAKQIYIGVPYYDVFVYLNNALIFAGIPVGNLSVIYLSPLMPFLTSIFFRLGFISSNVIFILDGFLFILGVIGLYLLFNKRFKSYESVLGCIIFIGLPLVFTWAVSGGIDVPGIIFTIWVVYIFFKGMDENPRYLYLVFPLLTIAFLTRYTAGLIIIPLILYLLINKDIKNNLKNLSIGLMISAIIIAPFLLYVLWKLGTISPLTNIFYSTVFTSNSVANDLGYNPDRLYYLKNFLNYLAVGPVQGTFNIMQNPSQGRSTIIGILLGFFALAGLISYFYNEIKHPDKKVIYASRKLMVILLITLTVLCISSFLWGPYIITEIIMIACLYLAYILLFNHNSGHLKMDFFMLAWFLSFFIFHSTFPLKMDRYFITMTPPLSYFLLLGWISSLKQIKRISFQKNLWKQKKIFLIVICALLLSSTTITHVGHSNQKGYVHYMNSACAQLVAYDPHYQEKNIYSDYDPAMTWLLQTEVQQTVPRLTFGPKDFSNRLKSSKADYYIDALTEPKWEIPGYHRIQAEDEIAIYVKNK